MLSVFTKLIFIAVLFLCYVTLMIFICCFPSPTLCLTKAILNWAFNIFSSLITRIKNWNKKKSDFITINKI